MKISIITATYNSENKILDCLSSVSHQSFDNTEHIIIDGKSSDNTLSIIENQGGVDYILSEPDQGIYDAMNKGIKLATGDIVGILNSDDCFHDDNVLSDVVRVFEENPDIDCLYGNLEFVDDQGNIVRKWVSKPFESGLFEKSWSPAHPTFYCRRAVFEKYGLYKTNYKIAADVEFMFRMLELNRLKSLYYDRFMVKMAMGGASTQGVKSTYIITKELQQAFRENGFQLNLFKYLFYKGLKLKEFITKK